MPHCLPTSRRSILAALNGLVGDHLAATQNPLAIPMRLRRCGRVIEPKRSQLATAIPDAREKVLLFLHGLYMNDLQWGRNGRNPGAVLADELGWTPVHLHYNTGLHVSTNGRALADLLEKLAGEWPVPLRQLGIILHSCGGLLARSAQYYGASADHCWTKAFAILGVPRHTTPRLRAGTRGQLREPCFWAPVLTVRHWDGLPVSAARGLRTCDMATWSIETGKAPTDSKIRATRVSRCRFRTA